MEYTILSLQALPFLLPIVICAIVLNVALYAHLNFKHLDIKKISMLAALAIVALPVFYVPLLSKMAFDYNIPLAPIHMAFAGVCFIGVLIFAVVVPKRAPTILQMLGLAVFLGSFYSLLA